MASGGSGSGFNPFKKKGLLTPKLPKKDNRKQETNKEKAPENCDEVPEASTSFAEQGEDQSQPPSHGPAQAMAESPAAPVVAMFPCERPLCGHCQMNPAPSGTGRLSLSSSSENLAATEPKAVAKRKSKTLTLRRQKKESSKSSSKQGKFWGFRIKKRVPSGGKKKDSKCPEPAPPPDAASCVCTSYKRTEEAPLQNLLFSTPGPSLMGASASPIQPNSTRSTRLALGAGPGPTGVRRLNPQLFHLVPAPAQNVGEVLAITRSNNDDYPTEDIDEMMIQQRARDMELGIEISPSHFAYPHLHYSSSVSSSSSGSSGSSTVSDHAAGGSLNIAFQNQCVVTTTTLYPGATGDSMLNPRESFHESEYGEFGALSAPLSAAPTGRIPRTVHTQVDYIHCLVPDLVEITKCSFYWGVIDRYEAERLLEHRPEGTFLLRDSAQEEFLFSVSFRRYGRSLHARIEQWNHKFSFDSHDPGVFASDTVCGLMEHYKDPSCCMFFEPMLTIPLNRTFPFSLQHLCRTVICNTTTYDGVNFLPLPKSLRDYLKYYHYKQKVRVRRFEVHN